MEHLDSESVTIEENRFSPFPELRWRRTAAFLVDLAIVWATWMVINNLIPIPMSREAEQLLRLLYFCGYFCSWGLPRSAGSTAGKRLFVLGVVQADGSNVTLRSLFVRALVIGAIVVVEWPVILGAVAPASTPVWVFFIPFWLARGMLLYEVMLLFTGPERLTLHDRIGETRVVDRSIPPEIALLEPVDSNEKISPRSLLPWPGRLVICLLAGLVYTGLLFGIPLSMTGQPLGDLLKSKAGDFTHLNQAVESSIGEYLDLRSQVSIEHRVHWQAESSASGTTQEQSSSLEVSVWIPRVQWTEANRDAVTMVIFQALTIDPEYYPRVDVLFSTGSECLKLSEQRLINIPTEANGQLEYARPPRKDLRFKTPEIGIHFGMSFE